MIEVMSRDALNRILDDFGNSKSFKHDVLAWLWSWAEDESMDRFRAEFGKLTRNLPELKDVKSEAWVLSTHIRRYEKEDSKEAAAIVRFLSCIRSTMIDENEKKEAQDADDGNEEEGNAND